MPGTLFSGDAARGAGRASGAKPAGAQPPSPPPEGRGLKAAHVLLLAAALALFAGPKLAALRPAGAVERYASLSPGRAAAYSDAALGAVKPRDYALREPAGAASDTLYIWDWADEDGDVVQVLVDGKPVPLENDWGTADPSGAAIRRAPLRVSVPVPCAVEIVGVRDGAGGVTYALYSANLGRTFLNRAPAGGRNAYRLAPAGS